MTGATPEHDVSRHKCLIYEGEPSSQVPVVVPFLIDGLQRGRRCLYLGHLATASMIEGALRERGVDVAAEKARGALVFSDERVNGSFDPGAMVELLAQTVDDAVAAGFAGLCATGDMAWELGSEQSFGRLLEYETRLERLFADKPLHGICMYRAGEVPPSAILDALLSHRSAFVGQRLRQDNFFFMPPKLLCDGELDRARHCEWMCQQILRVQQAERERDQARSSVQDLQSLSYGVAHDLRAPLRQIDHRLVQMGDAAGALAPEVATWLSAIRSNTAQMAALIDRILQLGLSGHRELAREILDLSAICAQIVEELRQQDSERSAVTVEIDAPLWSFGDPVLLRAVLDNLIGNAWKFTSKRADGLIRVSLVEQRAGRSTFCVSDNGAGFAPDAAARLFQPFERLHPRDEFPGTGVGLATVKRIVERHGGDVWAEGSAGVGACFYFALPDAPTSA